MVEATGNKDPLLEEARAQLGVCLKKVNEGDVSNETLLRFARARVAYFDHFDEAHEIPVDNSLEEYEKRVNVAFDSLRERYPQPQLKPVNSSGILIQDEE